MSTTFEVLYLGTGPQIDPTEGNSTSENASALVGSTYGSVSSPLAFTAQRIFSPVDYSGGNPAEYDTDNTSANDTFRIDGGPAQTFDGVAAYNATLTYTDGTPDATITAVVFQDTAGNLYLAPELTTNADYAAMTAAPIRSLTLDSVSTNEGVMGPDRAYTDFVCFAAGTRILTPSGPVPVESLNPGDRVATLDHGAQPVRWISRRVLTWGPEPHRSKPIRFGPGSLGPGIPERALIVSPQHRMLMPARHGSGDVLVPAKALTGLPGVRQMKGRRRETYLHLVFDRHEIVLAEGAPAESLLQGDVAVRSVGAPDRAALYTAALRGALWTGTQPGQPARALLRPGRIAGGGAGAFRVWSDSTIPPRPVGGLTAGPGRDISRAPDPVSPRVRGDIDRSSADHGHTPDHRTPAPVDRVATG